MLPTTPNGAPTTEPQLTDRTPAPRGVLQKNLKMMVYVGAVLILILAMFVSGTRKKATATDKPKDAIVAPVVQDNTANNVAALHTQLQTEKQRQQQDAALAAASATYGTAAQQAAASPFGANGQALAPTPCGPGQVCNPPAASAQRAGWRSGAPAHPGAAADTAARREGAGAAVCLSLRVESGLQPIGTAGAAGATPAAAGRCTGATEPLCGQGSA